MLVGGTPCPPSMAQKPNNSEGFRHSCGATPTILPTKRGSLLLAGAAGLARAKHGLDLIGEMIVSSSAQHGH